MNLDSTLACAGGLAVPKRSDFKQTAFTLIELLVVIVTVAILAVMLLPALAGTQAQSKVTACTARFRQWAASANLYANDNRGWLPTADPVGAGHAQDVGTNLPAMLYPYGMDIPNWFCPMRPNEFDAANVWEQTATYYNGQPVLGHSIQNIYELIRYWSQSYPYECQLNDNYWVPRYNGPTRPINPTLFPPDYTKIFFPPVFIKAGNPTCLTYGWPKRLHDVAVPYVPFVSDLAMNPASTNVTNISPTTAHFVNGTLIGVNLAFADGHVASHTPDQMRAVYKDNVNYWFY